MGRPKHRSIHDARYRSLIGELVKLRKLKGISQCELAKRLNLLQSDISKIEQYQRRVDVLETILWLDALGEGHPGALLAEIVAQIYANPG